MGTIPSIQPIEFPSFAQGGADRIAAAGGDVAHLTIDAKRRDDISNLVK